MRGLSSAQITAIQGRMFGIAHFVQLTLPTGNVNVWTGVGPTTNLGTTWYGLGELASIAYVGTSTNRRAQPVQITLDGLPSQQFSPGLVAATRGIRYQGQPISIYLAITDTTTGLPIADPSAVWTGLADAMTFRMGKPESVTLTLTCEHLDSQLRRPNGWLMTTASHNARLNYPPIADRFFDVATAIMAAPRGAFS